MTFASFSHCVSIRAYVGRGVNLMWVEVMQSEVWRKDCESCSTLTENQRPPTALHFVFVFWLLGEKWCSSSSHLLFSVSLSASLSHFFSVISLWNWLVVVNVCCGPERLNPQFFGRLSHRGPRSGAADSSRGRREEFILKSFQPTKTELNWDPFTFLLLLLLFLIPNK